MKRFLLALLILPPFIGCSEPHRRMPAVNPEVPEVRVFYPPDIPARPFMVSDSIEIYAGAAVASASELTVRFLFARPNRPAPDLIGEVSNPVPLADVPAPVRPYLQLPEGWRLYRRWWYTGPQHLPPAGTPINSGTTVQLFATVVDANGAEGRSDFVRVPVFNDLPNLHGPRPEFRFEPVTPAAGQTVRFDPGTTTDDIDPDSLVQVRWDFDGDGTWDIDWGAGATAAQKQAWSYPVSKDYLALLQTRNSYLPDSVTEQLHALHVTPAWGRPAFPDSGQCVLVPASSDTIGATRYRMDGKIFDADTLEYASVRDATGHRVRVRHVAGVSAFRILSHEVTNTEYLDYLHAELGNGGSGDRLIHDPARSRILFQGKDPGAPQEGEVSWVCLELKPEVTKIFYSPEEHAFRIRPGFEDHPVTGVTWKGAYIFCMSYGVRLPTEAEWEIAARGSHADYAYPFGVSLDDPGAGARANFNGSGDPFEASGTTPAGFYDGSVHEGFATEDDASPYGLHDMAGNVAEWTDDWLGRYGTADEVNPQGPTTGVYKVVRGGSYMSSRAGIRCTARAGESELETSFASVGFRCVWSVDR